MPPPSCPPPCICDNHELYNTDWITEITLFPSFLSQPLPSTLSFHSYHLYSQSNPVLLPSVSTRKATTNLLVHTTILNMHQGVQEHFY